MEKIPIWSGVWKCIFSQNFRNFDVQPETGIFLDLIRKHKDFLSMRNHFKEFTILTFSGEIGRRIYVEIGRSIYVDIHIIFLLSPVLWRNE